MSMDNGTVFTCMWTIENYSYCWHSNGERLVSPEFTVEELEGTVWYLVLYPRGLSNKHQGHISLGLYRAAVDKGPKKLRVHFELSLLSEDGSVIKCIRTEYSFSKGIRYCWPEFREMSLILLSTRTDTLRVCFKIWKLYGDDKLKTQIYSRTRIGVEHISFCLVIENFSAIKPNEKKIAYLKISSKNGFDLSSKLYLSTCSCCEEKIMVEITTSDVKHILSKLKISLLDVSGKEVACGELDNRVDVIGNDNRILPLSLTRKDILNKKSEYLPDDKLSLSCECSLSTREEYAKIERIILKIPLVASVEDKHCIHNVTVNTGDVVQSDNGMLHQSTKKLSVSNCLFVAVSACFFGVCVSYLSENLSNPFSIW